MISRTIVVLLAVSGVLCGQGSSGVKPGDVAPQFVWSKILQPAGPAGHEPAEVFGSVAVIAFFPNVEANEPLVQQWNGLVDQFAGQGVRFVWIASQNGAQLAAWLPKHPMKGWLLLDEQGETAKRYGVEFADSVIVGSNGKIAGFTQMLPSAEQIQAVLSGKGDAHLEAAPFHMGRGEPKPNLPPSYEVHVSVSKTDGTKSSSGPDFMSEKGFGLRALLASLYETEENQVVLPDDLNGKKTRYDAVLVPPGPMEFSEMRRLMREGVEKHFGLVKSTEHRLMDVYVMTAVAEKIKALKASEEEAAMYGGVSSQEIVLGEGAVAGKEPTEEEMQKMMETAMLLAITATSTMREAAMILELSLHRPVIDETGLDGAYKLKVKGDAKTSEDFLRLLKEQTGLVVTPDRRSVEVVVFTKR